MLKKEQNDLLEYLSKQMGGSAGEAVLTKYLDLYNSNNGESLTLEEFLDPIAAEGYLDNGGFAFRKSATITREGRKYVKTLD